LIGSRTTMYTPSRGFWSPGYKLISKPPGRVVAFPQSWSSSSSSSERETQGGPRRRRRRSFQSSPFPNDLILFVSSGRVGISNRPLERHLGEITTAGGRGKPKARLSIHIEFPDQEEGKTRRIGHPPSGGSSSHTSGRKKRENR
jgi:hypothetical protein